jgi:hypothetical protein
MALRGSHKIKINGLYYSICNRCFVRIDSSYSLDRYTVITLKGSFDILPVDDLIEPTPIAHLLYAHF